MLAIASWAVLFTDATTSSVDDALMLAFVTIPPTWPNLVAGPGVTMRDIFSCTFSAKVPAPASTAYGILPSSSLGHW